MIESLTIINTVSNESIDMSMYTLNYALYEGGIDWGNVNTTHNTFQYPEQIGTHIASTTLGTRDVAINGYILVGQENESELEERKKILSALVNPFDDVRLVTGKYSISGKPSKNVTFSNTYKENNNVLCKFLINIYCSDPLFETNEAVRVSITDDVVPMFRFPLVIPRQGMVFGIRKQSLFADVPNTGVVDVGGIFTFTAVGTVNYPSVFNVATRETIRINKVMEAGESILVNTNKGSRSIVGTIEGVDKDYLMYWDFDTNDWLQIHVGTNVLGFDTSLNGVSDESYKNLTVSLSYHLKLFNLEDE